MCLRLGQWVVRRCDVELPMLVGGGDHSVRLLAVGLSKAWHRCMYHAAVSKGGLADLLARRANRLIRCLR